MSSEEEKTILVSKDIPGKAAEKLKEFGNVVLFETSGITYRQVSSHPDLFFCTNGENVVVAPNIPEKYKSVFKSRNKNIIPGKTGVGEKYPGSARYNVVLTESLLIHNLKITDPVVLETFSNLRKIDIPQGYARCSLLPLKNNSFITSDKGIYKVLEKEGFNVLYGNPEGIVLPGFKNGFFGGTAGVIDNKVLITGSLKYFQEGDKVKDFIASAKMEIIELYDGPLFDGGSIMVL